MIRPAPRPPSPGRGRPIGLWILSGLVALAFIGAGGAKLAGAVVMVELFDKMGLGQRFRHFTGLLEVTGGLGLPMSRWAFQSAVRLAVVMGGGVHGTCHRARLLHRRPVVLFVLTGIIADLRKP